jgi:hypothetical protein
MSISPLEEEGVICELDMMDKGKSKRKSAK